MILTNQFVESVKYLRLWTIAMTFQIVEQKEVFERRFNYRKDTKKINVSSYRKETRRETTVFLPSDKVRGHWFAKNGLKLGKSFC